MNNFPPLAPGDVLLVGDDSFAGRWIRAAGVLASGDAKYNHAAICLGWESPAPEVVESRWRVRRTPLDAYADSPVAIWRHVGLTTGQRSEIALKAMECYGGLYASLKIPLLGLDAIATVTFGKRVRFFSRLGFTELKVCSELVAWAYGEVLGGNVFGAPWRSLTPDDLDDFCRFSPDWSCVYRTVTP